MIMHGSFRFYQYTFYFLKEMKKYLIKIKITRTVLAFAKNEDEARLKIQDYVNAYSDDIEEIKIEEQN